MAESVSLLFELFEEVFSDDLPQEQVLIGADDRAVFIIPFGSRTAMPERVRSYEEFLRNNHSKFPGPSYIPEDFRSHFHVSLHTVAVVEHLLSFCNDIPHYTCDRARPPVELRKEILLMLWILRNPECLLSVADRFDICRATAYRVYR